MTLTAPTTRSRLGRFGRGGVRTAMQRTARHARGMAVLALPHAISTRFIRPHSSIFWSLYYNLVRKRFRESNDSGKRRPLKPGLTAATEAAASNHEIASIGHGQVHDVDKRPSPPSGPRHDDKTYDTCNPQVSVSAPYKPYRVARVSCNHLALNFGYSIYNTLPQQPGLFGMADDVIDSFFRRVFPLKSRRGY